MKKTVKPNAPQSGRDPATFTLRDLNRQPAAILRACEQRGSVRIHTRDGRTFSLRLETPRPLPGDAAGFLERMERHHARMASAGYTLPSAKAQKRTAEVVAGEP